MRMLIAMAVLLSTAPTIAQSPSAPHLAVTDDIAAAQAVAARSGDQIWPGLGRAPFGFLFVHAGGETLINDARSPEGFARNGSGPSSIATGPTTWRNPSMLAAMPVFGPPSVIVMGSPASTRLSPLRWQLTVLHEHFHQWQAALPGYYDRAAALDLANGDDTGMWMLNFPFPYADARPHYVAAARQLHTALMARDAATLRREAGRYLEVRRAWQTSVNEQEWRYLDFQLWQEGVARWTEIELGLRSGNRVIATEANVIRRTVLTTLLHINDEPAAREIVYPLGAAEAMLLERLDPDWRGCYRVSLGLTNCWNSLQLESAAQ
jgi:hypothetical protein